MDRNYEELFKAGNAAQLEKLKEKEGKKGGWDNIDFLTAARRIEEELEELYVEIDCLSGEEFDIAAVRREFADIANFAHIGILQCDKMLKRRCRVCGCTYNDCRGCIEKTGKPCWWVEEDLCSACAGENIKAVKDR